MKKDGTPLHRAASENRAEIVPDIARKKGANTEVVDEDKQTTLHFSSAFRLGQNIVEILLEKRSGDGRRR